MFKLCSGPWLTLDLGALQSAAKWRSLVFGAHVNPRRGSHFGAKHRASTLTARAVGLLVKRLTCPRQLYRKQVKV